MPRRLFTLLSALSLLAALGFAAACANSADRPVVLSLNLPNRFIGAAIDRGELHWEHDVYAPAAEDDRAHPSLLVTFGDILWKPDDRLGRRPEGQPARVRRIAFHSTSPAGDTTLGVLPAWALLAALAALPALWLTPPLVRRLRRSRRNKGTRPRIRRPGRWGRRMAIASGALCLAAICAWIGARYFAFSLAWDARPLQLWWHQQEPTDPSAIELQIRRFGSHEPGPGSFSWFT